MIHWQKLEKELNSKIRLVLVDTIRKCLEYDTLAVVRDDTYVLKSAIGDTILTGVPVKIEGKKTPVKFPQPVSSLPFSHRATVKREVIDGLRFIFWERCSGAAFLKFLIFLMSSFF